MKRSSRTRLGPVSGRRAGRRLLVLGTTLALAVALPVVATTGVSQIVDDTRVNAATDPDNQTWQVEPSLEVRGSTICAGFNDSGADGVAEATGSVSGYARSTNSGQTWTDLGELGVGHRGDGIIAVNQTTGTFYFGENAIINGDDAIGVARSTDNCQTFPAPLADASPVSSINHTAGDNTTFIDKPSIAVDNTGGVNNGNIYVCFTRFVDTDTPIDNIANTSELRASRSIDGGLSYVNEQVIAPQGPAPFGCSVKVGPNGEVNVAWADRFGPTTGDIRFVRSTDGGVTFPAASTPVSTGNRLPGVDRQVNCSGNNRTTLNGDIRMLHQAWLAADATGGPFNGNLYAVWQSDPVSPPGTSDHSDVFFSRSINGGVNWSTTPLQLGATTATDQFQPYVAVGGGGVVSVAWYDRINDAATNTDYDLYKAFSTDGGATFGTAQRVSNVSFGVPPLRPHFDPSLAGNDCHLGEYIGVAADANAFYYIWSDNRNTLPTGPTTTRPDPDIFFESEAVPAGAPATLTLAPDPDSNPVDAQHCVTATVQDVFGRGTPNITVRFTVTGSVNTSGSQVTDANGQATFCYTGPPLPGADTISAYADTNNNTTQDTGEPGDTAAKTWTLPTDVTPCDIKISNGGWIITDDGDRASFGGNAKESATGVDTGHEQYHDHGPAEPLAVKSLNVLAITCNATLTKASIFGQATINGSGSFFYRIDVEDNGEPGKLIDHYRMRLITGYDSGDHVLRGGNVQIH